MDKKSIFAKQDLLTQQAHNYILSIASLFENDFSVDWLTDLTKQKPSVILNHLEAEIEAGGLKSRRLGVYYFAKTKKRTQFLSLLSKEEQMVLHGNIASLLLDNLPNDKDRVAAITYHLLRSENDLEKCGILVYCGDVFRRNFNLEKSFHCYEKVLNDLSKAKSIEADHLFASTAVNYSKTSTAVQDTPVVIATLNEALRRAKRCGNISTQALLEMHIAKNEWIQNHYQQAISHFETGWTLAKDLNTPEILRSASSFSTFFLYWQGRFQEAIQSYEQSFPEIENHSNFKFPLMATMTVGACYVLMGQVPRGLGLLDSIRAHCIDIGDRHLASDVYANLAWTMLEMRNIDEAFQYADEALKLSEETGNRWIWICLHLIYAYAYYCKGNDKKCVEYLKQFFEHSRSVHATVAFSACFLELCWAIEKGHLAKVKGISLKNELNNMIHSENLYAKGIAYRFQAMLMQRSEGTADEIMNSYKESILFLTSAGAKPEIARSQLEMARFLTDRDKQVEADLAISRASEALDGISEPFIPGDLKSIKRYSQEDKTLLKEIIELGHKVVLIRNTKDLLNYIISAVNRIFNAERGAIFLSENDSSGKCNLYLRASNNLTSEQINLPNFALSMEMIEQTFKSQKGQIYHHTDIGEKKHLIPSTISSMICVPMIIQNNTIGVLYHDNRLLKSAFKETDMELLNYFAGQAALAIENASAYEEIYNLNQKLQEEKFYEEERHVTLSFNEIVGTSHAINQVLLKIEQVASTEANVLILGETGTGKELVARAIHQHSNRHDKPFVVSHLGSMPNSLIPSELFGHVKGAYTGADHHRIGRFELAHSGTIFLDEIGEISEDIQIRLLRILQTHEFERIGDSDTRKSNFRLICATNRDLEQLTKINRFRSDLYYRINVFPIIVPPLRERKEDIPMLAQHFLEHHSSKLTKKFNSIPKEQLSKLMSYDWPGNIRELENIIERATILSKAPNFLIPDEILKNNIDNESDEGFSLADNERRHIIRTLKKTNWKVSGIGGAAELLKIKPSTLEFRMRKLKIKRPQKKEIVTRKEQ